MSGRGNFTVMYSPNLLPGQRLLSCELLAVPPAAAVGLLLKVYWLGYSMTHAVAPITAVTPVTTPPPPLHKSFCLSLFIKLPQVHVLLILGFPDIAAVLYLS
jgi:hypothetical protein